MLCYLYQILVGGRMNSATWPDGCTVSTYIYNMELLF